MWGTLFVFYKGSGHFVTAFGAQSVPSPQRLREKPALLVRELRWACPLCFCGVQIYSRQVVCVKWYEDE